MAHKSGPLVRPALALDANPSWGNLDGVPLRVYKTTGGLLIELINSAGTEIGTLSAPLRNQQVGTADVNVTGGTVAEIAATTGGLSIYSFLSTAAVQAAAIKAGAGQVYALHFFNNSATICYVRLYDMATSPTTGSAVVYRGMIPANTNGTGYVVPIPPGVVFATGIGIRVTAAIADNDNTSLGANAILGNVFYR